ncbi:hypothetical protein ACN23B_28285 (plasmid) [Anabaena sp. FACHB-709]|uniref:Uncharacterized protein n=2 Tax=Nostocaceae TaxID=1162 RepID=A0A1Z4KVJ2_ANAVA|nr:MULTISPECIES: hypothetical protein [Nostocaceae]BAY72937.1 hypothetical protein NIES23_57650 [Trichormus variabilis NIES-23]MBD2175266.1 hypothetical protein [Anabaena cylindrica FACHB-318]MBD2267162.1 hypothetical protein [Anabaena sp. FACHB-709]MBD2276714.1 hypothetical protein [Nostoc sp. PCC 7120 = FACHB-418]MBD2287197.1 hypothetical protein [Anabaena cylindrica FACHB-170]
MPSQIVQISCSLTSDRLLIVPALLNQTQLLPVLLLQTLHLGPKETHAEAIAHHPINPMRLFVVKSNTIAFLQPI